MKKTNQTDLDFDMIDLDETAGWNALELESALEREYFDGNEEIVYEEEYEQMAEYEEDAIFSEDEYLDENPITGVKKKTSKSGKSKKRKKKKPLAFADKVQAIFAEMTALDGIIAVTGVMVLVVAIVTVSVFSGAKIAQQQVEAFAPLGEEMECLVDVGKGTLLAMSDGQKLIQDEETEEEMTFEYEEKELEVTTVNVNMKLTSVQRDLKIKFVNHKTGKLIPHVEFKVSVEKADGKEKEYTDDDKDGIIYLSDMEPGKVTVTMLAMSGEEGLAFNTAPQTIKIKDKIEYKKIDVSEEVKSESEINAAIEDTAKENEVEAELKDTVEWVASTKTEVGVQESYVEVKKDNISDPANTAKVTFLRMTQITESSAESTSSSENSSEDTSKQENATPTPPPETTTTPESTTPPETTTTPESTTPPETTTTPESTTSPESTTTPESTTEEETTTEETTTPPPSSTVPENPAKTDTVTPLKDNSGNQMYLRTSDGKFVEAKYADYYNDKAVFYKRLTTPASYKYTGWQNVDGKTYFYDKNNNAVTGEQVIQGAKYNFASDGALITGSGTLGIDVSKWNGNIDWNAVKNSGVSYVIIRCGYRGSTTGAMIEDPKFKTNIRGANAAGLKVGIYFFSQAVNEVEAVEEASMTINLIKNYSISYPVFLDVEPSGGRADGIDKNTRTQVIKAYCETIRNSGYTAGVYANKTWLTSYMNVGELGAYKIWLAQYNTAPTYSGRIDLWQYTSKGQVNGIGGHTDLNLSYLGY